MIEIAEYSCSAIEEEKKQAFNLIYNNESSLQKHIVMYKNSLELTICIWFILFHHFFYGIASINFVNKKCKKSLHHKWCVIGVLPNISNSWKWNWSQIRNRFVVSRKIALSVVLLIKYIRRNQKRKKNWKYIDAVWFVITLNKRWWYKSICHRFMDA